MSMQYSFSQTFGRPLKNLEHFNHYQQLNQANLPFEIQKIQSLNKECQQVPGKIKKNTIKEYSQSINNRYNNRNFIECINVPQSYSVPDSKFSSKQNSLGSSLVKCKQSAVINSKYNSNKFKTPKFNKQESKYEEQQKYNFKEIYYEKQKQSNTIENKNIRRQEEAIDILQNKMKKLLDYLRESESQNYSSIAKSASMMKSKKVQSSTHNSQNRCLTPVLNRNRQMGRSLPDYPHAKQIDSKLNNKISSSHNNLQNKFKNSYQYKWESQMNNNPYHQKQNRAIYKNQQDHYIMASQPKKPRKFLRNSSTQDQIVKQRIRTIQSEFSQDQTERNFKNKNQSIIVQLQQKLACTKDISLDKNTFVSKIKKINDKIDSYTKRVNQNFQSRQFNDKKKDIFSKFNQYQKDKQINQDSDRLKFCWIDQQSKERQVETLRRVNALENKTRVQPSQSEQTAKNRKHNKLTMNNSKQKINLANKNVSRSAVGHNKDKSNVFSKLFRSSDAEGLYKAKIAYEKLNLPKLAVQFVKQLQLDEQLRKSKKQFAKIPDTEAIQKWSKLQKYLLRAINEIGLAQYWQCLSNQFQNNQILFQLFNVKDEQADPFYSISIENLDEADQIIEKIVSKFIATQFNWLNSLSHSFYKQELAPLTYLFKTNFIGLDDFTIAINELTKSNYKYRDLYMLYGRFKGNQENLNKNMIQKVLIS